MSNPIRVVLMLLVLALACILNLVLTRWGVDQPGVPILTIATEPSFPMDVDQTGRFGLYAAPLLDSTPWLAMAFGLVLPMMLIGLVVYILVRPTRPGSET